MAVNWETRYSRRLEWMTTSAIRDILKFAQAPDTISMAGGWPDAALFPIEQIAEICQHALHTMPQESLQYGLTDGLPALREALADHMTLSGMPAKVENIVITSGTQQGLDLMGRIFVDEGDIVLVENPTFLGALQSFKAYGARFVAVPADDDGADMAHLERLIAETRPKFMYLLPTFQNPTGITYTLERRREVLALAEAAGVPILEDDPYGALRFEGDHLPTLLSLDLARLGVNTPTETSGNVIYMSSFSKTLSPGLRIAWAVCPPEIAQQFVMAKQGSDLHTSALAQTIALEFLQRGWLPPQVQRIRATYLERRNAMVEALEEHFPPEVRFTRPQGGLFLWVTLPKGMDAVPLLQEAVQQKVAFVPGGPFHVDGTGQNTLRLSFASVPPDRIREGVRRLSVVVKRHLV